MSILPTRLRKRALVALAALVAPVAAVTVVSAVDASLLTASVSINIWGALGSRAGGDVISD
jgi:hypothetical protein